MGAFGDIPPVTATLLASNTPVAGKIVTIGIGATAQVGVTDANGNVKVNVPVQTLPGSYQLTAAFGGDEAFLPASTSASFTVGQATTSLVWDPALFTTLTASLNGTPTPLLQEAVKYVVSNGTAGSKTLFVNTDYAGRAPLPPTGLPAGSYSVAASYAGNATFAGATATLPALTIAPQIITFNGSTSLPTSITLGGAPITFTVASSAGQPVTVTLAPPVPPPGPYCTLTTSDNIHYTLTPVAPGTCTIVASAGATTTSTSVTVSQNIVVAKASQTITFGPLGGKTYGDAPFSVSATASSGLPVTFTAAGSACTVANGTT